MSTTIPTPTAEQEQRAKWNLLLLDIDMRTERVRQLKRYEPWRLILTAVTSSAALMGAGFALAKLFT